MTRQRNTVLLLSITALAASAIWWFTSTDAEHSGSAGLPPLSVVRSDVPDHELLQSALDITSWQQSQHVANFTALPATRPGGVSRLLIGGGGEAVLDTYHMTSGLIVVLAFSTTPLHVCTDKRPRK